MPAKQLEGAAWADHTHVIVNGNSGKDSVPFASLRQRQSGCVIGGSSPIGASPARIRAEEGKRYQAMADNERNDNPRRITIERLMAETGLGPIQARRDVRKGLLPGRMRGKTYICTPGEFDRWYRGDWTPRPQPRQVDLVRRRKKKGI